MLNSKKIPPSYRRALLIYLLAIVGPTLVLIYLGLISVQRQGQTITSLTTSNLRMSGEKLAEELEHQIWQLAAACLEDENLTQLNQVSNALTPENVQIISSLMKKAKRRHPITSFYFMMQGNSVFFPILRIPSLIKIDSYIAREDPSIGKRFMALFLEGETKELREQHPELAILFYQKSTELPVSDWLKALALGRMARCFQKINRLDKAEQTYSTLADQYGNLYDQFFRPYGLVAAVELYDISKIQQKNPSHPLTSLFRDIFQGRWELSADQMDYFLAEIEKRLPTPVPQTDETPYLDYLEFGRALETEFRHFGPLQANEVYAYAFNHKATDYQTFYTPFYIEKKQTILTGFSVDLSWVENEFLPKIMRELKTDDNVKFVMQKTQDHTSNEEELKVQIAFKNLFPFWKLFVTPVSIEVLKTSTRNNMLVFGGIMLLIFAVLILGGYLLIRDVSRELKLVRLQGDFIGSVSHELKTPLTLIRLYGETLLHGKGFREHDRKKFYRIITQESERLSHLIEKVLDFSSIDKGQKQYNLKKGDIYPAIESTVNIYKQYLESQGYTVEIDLTTDLPSVLFDPEAVSAAILNLMDNAAKFTGESKYVGVRLFSEADQVILDVEDHGIGIPTEEYNKIFQQFYRASSKSQKGGYGLGLYLVRHIMDAHGGKVELDSKLEQGSRFRLIFPRFDS